MNPQLRVMVSCMVIGVISGIAYASWNRPEDDRNYLGHALIGGFLGLMAGAFVAA